MDSPTGDKRRRTLAACRAGDLTALVGFCTSRDGLLDDEVRRIAWPVLLGSPAESASQASYEKLPSHRDEEQVQRDVDRSFVHYPQNQSEEQLKGRRAQLQELIVEALRLHPFLCYFQGYHDIVQVLLLVLGKDVARQLVARLSLVRIRDFMLPTLSGTMPHLHLLPSILHVADPAVERHLSLTQPFFALAATLTLYAHDIQEYGDIARLFDFLLAHEASMSIYLFAVIIVSRKEELLRIDADEPEMLHSVLSKLPKPLNLESLIASAMSLFAQHPPRTLPDRVWRRVSSNSVLKTTENLQSRTHQSLAEASRSFRKQATQIAWAQKYATARDIATRHQRPATAVGFALLVGALSWWLRRENNFSTILGIWQRFLVWART